MAEDLFFVDRLFYKVTQFESGNLSKNDLSDQDHAEIVLYQNTVYYTKQEKEKEASEKSNTANRVMGKERVTRKR